MQKAFAYLRVSGKGQVDGDGFPRQVAAIRQYAAINGYRIVRVFREEGVSGLTEWENRPAFSEMMALLLADGTRTVLVERLDRVARELLVQESIIADFARKRLTLVSVNEPDMCSGDPARIMFRQMLGVFSQYEKTVLVAKLKAATACGKEVAPDHHCTSSNASSAKCGAATGIVATGPNAFRVFQKKGWSSPLPGRKSKYNFSRHQTPTLLVSANEGN
jgi:predicted site-specific integrase-resolvase